MSEDETGRPLPWQIRRDAFLARSIEEVREYRLRIRLPELTPEEVAAFNVADADSHRAEVSYALADGKDVPAEVLSDYPGIKAHDPQEVLSRYGISIF